LSIHERRERVCGNAEMVWGRRRGDGTIVAGK
jgi:hypothetical protein